jgi:predicted glycogen debranching enzyme
MSPFEHDTREWLEADGLGGFASGTVCGERTRRYHALLLTATTPPTGRVVLVNGFDAWVETAAGRVALTTQRYVPDVRHPDGASRIVRFTRDPWPAWELACDVSGPGGPTGLRIRQELFVPHGHAAVVLAWRVVSGPPVRLIVRPFLTGRDYHATHHENGALRADAHGDGDGVRWAPYPGLPAVASLANARYAHAPAWYRQFLYAAERERGLDDREDAWSPGELTWELETGRDAVWLLEAVDPERVAASRDDVTSVVQRLQDDERARRERFASPLERAADSYLVRRNRGATIVAGYPWFTDWGRDTFIAMRGLCLTTGRFDEARAILLEWSTAVQGGLLPNRFPDAGEQPEYNSVDAALWFVAAVQAFCHAADRGLTTLSGTDRDRLCGAVDAIVEGCARGTRYGIRADRDGLLACGEPGVQLTWMDAKVGDRVVTPRTGKPVEVQALWLNALRFAADEARRRGGDDRWARLFAQGRIAFETRFWNEAGGCLYDVVDVDHEPGRVDDRIRPNQVLAVGGLPLELLPAERARLVVARIERDLLTPLGLRSLAPDDPEYRPAYGGAPQERDSAYHQGTVWPWLLGPFVDAWLRVHADEADAAAHAHARFIEPLLVHLDEAGLGHVSEIADADFPFTPRGCPFQAWSLGELLRARARVAAAGSSAPARAGVTL